MHIKKRSLQFLITLSCDSAQLDIWTDALTMKASVHLSRILSSLVES